MEKIIELEVNGQESFETEEIEGILDCIVVESDQEIQFSILSELGYLIYNNPKHEGVKYYAPRALTSVESTNRFSLMQKPFQVPFNLKENLLINVSSLVPATVKLIFRIS